MATTAKLDKTSYSPGETMTLTVTSGAGERANDKPISVKVSIPELSVDTTLTGKVDGPDFAVVVTDTSRVWTPVSDNGTVAVFTAKA